MTEIATEIHDILELVVVLVRWKLGLCSMEVEGAVTGREGRVVERDDKLVLWRQHGA